jgi:hypothetical protein
MALDHLGEVFADLFVIRQGRAEYSHAAPIARIGCSPW